MVIDSATIEIKRQGATAELVVQRRPFAFSIKLSLDELDQLITELATDARVWRQAQRPDYYAILGLSRSASMADVKRAYRRLSRKFHPDVSPDTGAAMQQLNAAYEALKRKKHDQSTTI